MTQKRVVVGSDDRGRPITRWEDADPRPDYGFMEPVYTTAVERRQATPEELAAAREREAERGYLASVREWTPHDIDELREATGAVTGEDVVLAMREAAEPPERPEEGPVVDTEDVIPTTEEAGPLATLAAAAAAAQDKWLAVVAAEEAWEIARVALSDAMTHCLTILHSPNHLNHPPSPATGATALPPVSGVNGSQPSTSPETVSAPATSTPEPAPTSKAKRQPGRHASHAGEAAARAERAARVTEAVARHGGDRSAAAAELGMRPNAVAMVLKHADRRSADA